MQRVIVLQIAVALLAAGEATMPTEAVASLDSQAKSATKVAAPSVVGAWIWGGRADAQYRPFFEWDLRIAAGQFAMTGLRARISTLGPKQEVLREGAWTDVAAINAGGTRDLPIRLNCPTFAAWKLELTWKDGKATWIGPDRRGLPLQVSDSADQPLLITAGADADPTTDHSAAVATWQLWNLGGQPATGVVQTVRLKNAAGVVVASAELKLAEPVPAHTTRTCTVVVPKVKTWEVVSIEVRNADVPVGSLILTPPLGEGPDLVVEKITIDGGTMTAVVHNRLGKPLMGAMVTVTFNAAGKPVRELSLPVTELADDASMIVKTALDPLPQWDEYTLGWTLNR